MGGPVEAGARIVSGMRATGPSHIGHYQGIFKNWVQLQKQYTCFFFIADWHGLTTHYADPAQIREYVFALAVDFLAVGLDPAQCTLFLQSDVPEHATLALLLGMLTPLGWLERVPTYKEQIARLQGMDLSTYGFLGYPVLQAADILLYRAAGVPVGEDQVPHLEFARELVRRFQFLYAQDGARILHEPQPVLSPAPKLLGVDGQKMSKSYHNTIGLREAPERVALKIKTMPTDPARIRRQDPGDPERCPVWSLHAAYSDPETQHWVQHGCRSAGIGCVECKASVSRQIAVTHEPMRERAEALQQDPDAVRDMLRAGAVRARAVAGETLAAVQQAMGIGL